MRLELEWEHPDGSSEPNCKGIVDVDLADFRTVREFERYFEVSYMTVSNDGVPLLSHLMWLGWWQALREELPLVPANFETSPGEYCWVDALVKCMIAGEQPESADPLEPSGPQKGSPRAGQKSTIKGT